MGFDLIATEESARSASSSTDDLGFIEDIKDVPGVSDIVEGLRRIKRGHADAGLKLIVDGIEVYADHTGKNIPW